jgi:hypothetical protein
MPDVSKEVYMARLAMLFVLIVLAAGCSGSDTQSQTTDAEPDISRSVLTDSATGMSTDGGQDMLVDAMLPDSDGDGVADPYDAFPDDPEESADGDGDGVGDNSDAFPRDANESMDSDGDSVGDNEDAFPLDASDWADRDGDGVGDNLDPFPNDPDESHDNDFDGLGDNEDTDDDNDGLSDTEEAEYGRDCAISSPLRSDTDGDEIEDEFDPYPRDPHPEFIVRKAENGLIDLFLSNRDGTFSDVAQIGEAIEHMGTALSYDYFAVGDFDGNGVMDFLGQSSPLVAGQPERNVYFFVRDLKADEFHQRLIGVSSALIHGVVADVNGDFGFDLVTTRLTRSGNITGGQVATYLNNGHPGAECVVGDTAEDGCFFRRTPVLDITPTVQNQWVMRFAFQAVNLNPLEDAFPDLTLVTYASGGNAPSQVYSLSGRGDGTFNQPVLRLTHNPRRQLAPANTVLFADFDNDGVGDVMMGFDDDGQAGSAWTYFGMGDGDFFDMPIEALDLNPGNQREMAGGSEFLGRESSGRTFDFDFDGNSDLIVGYHHVNYDSPGQTRVYRGNGNGTFGPEFSVIGLESSRPGRFAIPQRLCPRFVLQRDAQ